jgi:hypothetical protein
MVAAIAKILHAISPQVRRMTRLVRIAGASEALAASLHDHARMAHYSDFGAELEAIATVEDDCAQALRDLLVARGVSPATIETVDGAGGSNWRRVSADLAAAVEMVRALNAAFAEWEGVDHAIADRLHSLAESTEAVVTRLRDLALRCDPQALD